MKRIAFCAQMQSAALWDALRQCRTVGAAVQHAGDVFRRCAVPEPSASAEFLATVSFDGVLTRSSVRHRRNDAIVPEQLERFINLCEQREVHRTPVQYLVGEWDFHHITLNVRPPVLIPRPETEELVQLVLDDVTQSLACKNEDDHGYSVLDVGCGSGAILIALLKARESQKWTGVGIDISEHAVALSIENSRLCKVDERASIQRASIVDLVARRDGEHKHKFDILVSNPPYILSDDMKELPAEVADHEDHMALHGGSDGLQVIREVLNNARHVVRPGGDIWMEVDESHPAKLLRLAFDGVEFVSRHDDMYGRQRFCHWKVV